MTHNKLAEMDPSRRRLLAAGAAATFTGALALGAAAPAHAADNPEGSNMYDVTSWKVKGRPEVTAQVDVGAVTNDIIADIKRRQATAGSRPGAVITIPPGDYDLRTQVIVDISFLTIAGFGHGFFSRSIKDNVDTTGWLELQPGGSHIRVLTPSTAPQAFLVRRPGSPRLSGVVFRDFCLDGVEFPPDGNSYRNGRTGIEVASDNDSFHITGMGFVYLEHALIVHGADALRVHDNMIAECGSCVELTGAGQATIVSNNLMGAGPEGATPAGGEPRGSAHHRQQPISPGPEPGRADWLQQVLGVFEQVPGFLPRHDAAHQQLQGKPDHGQSLPPGHGGLPAVPR